MKKLIVTLSFAFALATAALTWGSIPVVQDSPLPDCLPLNCDGQ